MEIKNEYEYIEEQLRKHTAQIIPYISKTIAGKSEYF
jgi:hypothetical protein